MTSGDPVDTLVLIFSPDSRCHIDPSIIQAELPANTYIYDARTNLVAKVDLLKVLHHGCNSEFKPING